jgi:predicted acylesterase/phospholipase RssA
MSIPVFFVPQQHAGHYVFDGGLKQNYPVEVLMKDAETLDFIGIYLGRPIYNPGHPSVPVSLYDALLEANDTAQLEKYQKNTVIIDPYPIGALDFSLDADQKRFLYLSGQEAAFRFLEAQGIAIANMVVVSAVRAELDPLRLALIAKRLRKSRRTKRGLIALIVVLLMWASLGITGVRLRVVSFVEHVQQIVGEVLRR